MQEFNRSIHRVIVAVKIIFNQFWELIFSPFSFTRQIFSLLAKHPAFYTIKFLVHDVSFM